LTENWIPAFAGMTRGSYGFPKICEALDSAFQGMTSFYRLLVRLRRLQPPPYASNVRILIVCMGNICRSPVVEAVVCAQARKAGVDLEVASAGTEDYHIGHGADKRSVASARDRGYDVTKHRAAQVQDIDFARYDHILVMDRVNLRALTARVPKEHAGKLQLFLEFAGSQPPHEVPDPYYGSASDFERVIDLAESGAKGLIERVSQAHNLQHALKDA
jgi:protein-tyrosine phosphatase